VLGAVLVLESERVLGPVLVLESECMSHYMAGISTNTRPLYMGILVDTFHVRQSDNRCCRRACKFSFPALVVSSCKPRNHVKMRRRDNCCSRSLKVEELERVLGVVLVLESELESELK